MFWSGVWCAWVFLRIKQAMNSKQNKDFWVWGDLRNQRLFNYSLNVLAKARELASLENGDVVMLFGDTVNEDNVLDPDTAAAVVPMDEACRESASRGADKIYILENENFTFASGRLQAKAIEALVEDRSPKMVLFPLTDSGREVAAASARLCNAGLLADCADLRFSEGEIIGVCPAWGGEIMAEITFRKGHGTGFATVDPQIQSLSETNRKKDSVKIERIPAETDSDTIEPRLLSCKTEREAGQKLEDAEIVVVGGAGLGNMEGFSLVRDLAAAMGGQVAATRPPVLQHWVDEDRLIGQTGRKVRPRLLLSIGTSGAIQYTAGIMESDTIVAVNRDPNAPVFQVADIGLVADAKTILPHLIAKSKQTVMRQLADSLSDLKEGKSKDGGFGAKIRNIREAREWSRETLAEATGQTPEFVEMVETGRVSPPVSFLLRLSGALGIDPGTFLHREEETAIRDQRAQAFIKRTRNYSYETLTPGAEQSHLRAFMVTIESHHAHKPVEYRHEGEEFIYVMEGDLELTLGGKPRVLKKGESIHFNSDTPHKLKSLSNESTRCLVMLYTV